MAPSPDPAADECPDCGHPDDGVTRLATCLCRCHDFEHYETQKIPGGNPFVFAEPWGPAVRWPWLFRTVRFCLGETAIPPCANIFCRIAWGRHTCDHARLALPPLTACAPKWQLCPRGCGLTHHVDRPARCDPDWLQREYDGMRAILRQKIRRAPDAAGAILTGLAGFIFGRLTAPKGEKP